MTQATTGGRNVSWRRIATGGLQVTVFSPDISPSTAAESDWTWRQQQKKNWSDIPCIDITLICDHSGSHSGVDKHSDLQGFYTSLTGKYLTYIQEENSASETSVAIISRQGVIPQKARIFISFTHPSNNSKYGP